MLIYWANILPLGVALFLAWRSACAKNLISPDMPTALRHGVERRIIIAQSLYAIGAALWLINTNTKGHKE